MAANPVTRQGAHGTLYLYALVYTDASDPGFGQHEVRHWAYNLEHAEDRFLSGEDSEGWKILEIYRVQQGISQHRAPRHQPRSALRSEEPERAHTMRQGRWSDWYREFRELAQLAGITPDEYEGSTGHGDAYLASLFHDGETPQAAVEWIQGRQRRRARGSVQDEARRSRQSNTQRLPNGILITWRKVAPASRGEYGGYLGKSDDGAEYHLNQAGPRRYELYYFAPRERGGPSYMGRYASLEAAKSAIAEGV